ncbi:PIG-L family deacetylase [Thalassospira sp.]|uniref:PIG-L deacetylase family protein n=1 Tax=Thalassospira sp. TaxID=1912094 RepID=UPI001B07C3B4|nr:PIG-L family deacetylase [Thalassospira sp.]MBO6805983.1 PIG-L family deacetylase [Thalassospira sp.]
MKNNVAVIAAHPDDEVLGMAGSIAKHVNNGDIVNILFMSDGVTGRDVDYDRNARLNDINARKLSAKKVSEILGISNIEFCDYPNLRMDTVSVLEVTQKIETRLQNWGSNIVYTHHSSDTNVDHGVCFKSTLIACRPVPRCQVRSIRCFEVLSSTEYSVSNHGPIFDPNLFVNVEEFVKAKIACVRAYDYEMRPAPFPRSEKIVEAQLTLRGSQVGLNAAEAFMEVRRIE